MENHSDSISNVEELRQAIYNVMSKSNGVASAEDIAIELDKLGFTKVRDLVRSYDRLVDDYNDLSHLNDLTMIENEKLKTYNDKLSQGIFHGDGCQFTNAIDQAKIDILSKLKEKSFQGYQVGMYIVDARQIDDLIEKIRKGQI